MDEYECPPTSNTFHLGIDTATEQMYEFFDRIQAIADKLNSTIKVSRRIRLIKKAQKIRVNVKLLQEYIATGV